ncbi:hypothetical protein AMTRI_Chr10g6880 [Amborella trichopoda]|uniref:BZIP domain-containing protein n=1 Tax=Amborella trichopoda TaxID=13333 RepID=W1PFH8_AMBTC|nr:basic leucine zipper 43 [Amborella trichopoda]ERN05815.1 hypothetical protein AMTR_s00006p00259200 [Amborella trichopoda]|eukprot:XP_006844140.1 basic leucine zipper 43 [Amborella trichopoda]
MHPGSALAAHFSEPMYALDPQLSPFPIMNNCGLPTLHYPNPMQSLCMSNSGSDEASEERQQDERRRRRMLSNRESARRSRMRKQRHLDELWTTVLRLRSENRQLIEKLNVTSEHHEKVMIENESLRAEVTDLRRMLENMREKGGECVQQPGVGVVPLPLSAFSLLRDFEEVSCNTAHLKAEAACQSSSIASSIDPLH